MSGWPSGEADVIRVSGVLPGAPAVHAAPSELPAALQDLPPDLSDEGDLPPSDEALLGHLVAILFAADEPLPISVLARLLEVRQSTVQRVAKALAAGPPPGILLQRNDTRLQLVTAPESARFIRRLRGLEDHARLSRAALEVLAVIAYRQPATRAEIEAIRGVNGDRAISTLLARGLIEEVGRRETVGRPVMFGTTLGFLEHLGLRSLEDLPPVPTSSDDDASPGDTS